MSFAFKFNYQPHYAEDTKHSFSKHVFNKGYCPLHPDVLIKKGFFKIKRQECWRCLQQYNQQIELFYTKIQEVIQEEEMQEEVIQEEVIQEEKKEEVIQEEVIQEEVIQEEVIQEEVIQEEKKEEVIQEEVIQEEVIQEQVIQEENKEEVIQEEVINKETEYSNKYIKIKRILFNFHYEIASPYKEEYKVFRCKFCKKGNITREEFKVISLGHQNCADPKHIRNQLPVCFNCNYNSSIGIHVREMHRLCRDIRSREEYVKKNNLVSLDEISFLYNNIDKFVPIV